MKRTIIRITESDIRRMVSNTVRRLVEGGEESPDGYHDRDEDYEDDPLNACEEESVIDIVVFLDRGEVMDGYYYDDENVTPNSILVAVRPQLYPNIEDDGQCYSLDIEGVRDASPEYSEDEELFSQNYDRIMQILDDNFDEIAKMIAERSDYTLHY